LVLITWAIWTLLKTLLKLGGMLSHNHLATPPNS
jgi:hypothetical protein